MTEVFNNLPGIALPVREVTRRLASMWETDDLDSPLAVHASQMNVVLHFGLSIGPEPARERFDQLVKFAQRYPCRIIVLCPSDVDMNRAMESKLFSQCYIGESHREMCCCEALILRHNPVDAEYLFNQVSVWLEGDLPTYYWFSEVTSKQVEAYLNSVKKLGVRRCIFDHSNELCEQIVSDSPDGCPINDLSEASLLPLQQVIGQFLSRYPVGTICNGLKAVEISYSEKPGEGRSLMKWVSSCLAGCKEHETNRPLPIEFELKAMELDSKYSLQMRFIYEDTRNFVFSKSKDSLRSSLRANFGESDELVNVLIKPIALDQVLAEAFFHR